MESWYYNVLTDNPADFGQIPTEEIFELFLNKELRVKIIELAAGFTNSPEERKDLIIHAWKNIIKCSVMCKQEYFEQIAFASMRKLSFSFGYSKG
jgi:hypothetical protein